MAYVQAAVLYVSAKILMSYLSACLRNVYPSSAIFIYSPTSSPAVLAE